MKRTALSSIMVTCLLCVGVIAQTAPRGWIAYNKPSEADLRCANYSSRYWRVALDGEQLSVRLDDGRQHQDPLPAVITSKEVVAGARHVISVNDGWLVGTNKGEFGGGLWWFGTDGRLRKKLSEENVVGFAKLSKEILVLTGLFHMGFSSGRVLRIVEGAGGDRSIKVIADLHSTPQAFAVESAGAILVLTTKGLFRVTTSGALAHLFQTDYGLLYPSSMTLSSSGVIHIGMRHFITRLTPAGETYTEEWFVPRDCTRFRTRGIDCVCG